MKGRLLPAAVAGMLALAAGGVLPRSGPHAYARAGAQRAAGAQTPRGEGGRVPPTLGPHEYFQGRPWRGRPGVTERIDTILARSAGLPAPTGIRVAGPANDNDSAPYRMDWPSAPRVSAWPLAGAGVEGGVSVADFASIATSWLGIDLRADSQWIPPDSNGSVGPTQVMVTANGRFKAFDKTGALLAFNVVDTAFFPNSVTNGDGLSDPHVRYDPTAQRWFISEITVPASGGANRIVIAVSSGPDVLSGSWTFFGFQQDMVGTVPNVDAGNFADYDTLGVDAHALYIGVNMFNGSLTSYEGTSGFVVNKADLIAGTLTVTPFRQLAGSSGSGPYTPQGVQNDDPASTEGYFIGVDNLNYSLLQVRRITNPGGTPSISGNLTISVPATSAPVSQPSLGTTHPLDAIDDRLFAAEITKDVLTSTDSLWTAHNIAVNSSGVASSGSGVRDGSRWYQIDNLTTTPTLTQSGTVYDSASSNPLGYWMPSVAANGQGHMTLSSSVASANTYAGIFATARLRTEPLGTTETGATFAGVGAYTVQSTTPQRWGDFSQVVIDPTDDQTFWAFEEYSDQASPSSWGVRVLKIPAPPPATPVSASPSQVAAGQASVDVTITGSSTGGSAFFDPGSGFSHRIAAAIGNNVVVNSATFMSETTVKLNISTVGATNGSPLITITNPDGQTASGYGLSITGSSDLSASPSPLQFGATKNGAGGALVAVTPAQTVTVALTGALAGGAWTASADQTWVQITNGSGNGDGQFSVGIVNPGNILDGSTSASSTITVSSQGVEALVPVHLTIQLSPGSSSPPFGYWDTPASGLTGVTGSIALTGWALDDIGVARVMIVRNCTVVDQAASPSPCLSLVPNDPTLYVYIADATFVMGARPDVAAAYPTAPQNERAGWGYLMLTKGLPDLVQGTPEGGQGTFTFSAFAIDQEGQYGPLGTKTITFDNEHATSPFGTIDTPGQGDTIPGPSAPYDNANWYPVFGWAMSPVVSPTEACMVPASYQVYVDGVSVPLTASVNWFTGLNRSDLANAFPGLCDSQKALAVYYLDASGLGLSTGLHTIGWTVFDDQGHSAGIGSRFFSLITGSGGMAPGMAERPPALTAPPARLGDTASLATLRSSTAPIRVRLGADQRPFGRALPDAAGRIRVTMPLTDRLTLDLGGAVERGDQVVGEALRPLPIGSTLDAAQGRFYWQPPVGFLGTFSFVFVRGHERIDVEVTLVDPTKRAR